VALPEGARAMALDSETDDSVSTLMRKLIRETREQDYDEIGRKTVIAPEWLNQSNAARYCGWSVQSFNEWSNTGKGPRFVRAGTKVRYKRAWLDEWMENGAHAGAA
jgi:hypothetical protein